MVNALKIHQIIVPEYTYDIAGESQNCKTSGKHFVRVMHEAFIIIFFVSSVLVLYASLRAPTAKPAGRHLAVIRQIILAYCSGCSYRRPARRRSTRR